MTDVHRTMTGRLTRRITNVRPGQWKWGGFWAIIALIFILFALNIDTGIVAINVSASLLGVIFLMVAGIGAWPYGYGPGYTYITEYFESRAIRRRGGRVAREMRPGARVRKTAKEPIEIAINSFPALSEDRTSIGTLYSRRTNCDTVLIAGKAWDGANTIPAVRMAREDNVAKAILDALNMSSQSNGIVVGLHKGPMNIWQHRNWAADAFHENVLIAGRNDFDQNPPQSVHERQSAIFSDNDLALRLFTRDVTAFIGINVERPPKFKAISDGVKNGTVSVAQFERRVMISKMVKRLEQNLRAAGITGVRTLNLLELKTFVKASCDISDMEEWYRKLEDPAFTGDTSIDHFWPWPDTEPIVKVDDTGRPYTKLGRTYYRVARSIRKNEVVYPGEFKPLFSSGRLGFGNETSLTVTMSGDTYTSSEEGKALNYAILFQDAFSKIWLDENRYKSLEERTQEMELKNRQDQLHLGGKQAMNHNTFACWGAIDSLELLQEMDDLVEEQARQCSIPLEIIPWESRQLKALFSASIGASLM